jgi:hypothetical protein
VEGSGRSLIYGNIPPEGFVLSDSSDKPNKVNIDLR